ncbi:MAG: hypothetical protein JW776_12280 [Candidatus Lokiarchaeota archaeon]|nr:hypothetical protein [Candidatus Lokiarchaeota archaeon]
MITSSSLDNILERFDEESDNFIQAIRIGRARRLSYQVKKYTLNERKRNWFHFVKSTKELKKREIEFGSDGIRKKEVLKFTKFKGVELSSLKQIQNEFIENIESEPYLIEDMLLNSCNLVCGTSTGVVYIYDEKRDIEDFDLMVIDESSKATVLEFLIPATRAKKWVIVGDQNQLPPYIDDRETKVFFQTYFEKFLPEILKEGNAFVTSSEYRRYGKKNDYEDFLQTKDVKVDPLIEELMKKFKRIYEELHFINTIDETEKSSRRLEGKIP